MLPGTPDDALLGLNRLATVSRLMSGAVHEVNNALQIISGTVEVLESKPDVPPSMRDALARVRNQSSRAAAALTQVLLFSRATRDAPATVNLREVAEQSLALRDFAIRRAGLSARLEVEGSAPCLVRGNHGDLQQALLNLIINAEQASQGSRRPIVVRLSADDACVTVKVVDEGPGFGALTGHQVFEPFVTSREPFESAGLGLWAARRLVELHGGTLELEAGASGSTFVIRMPGARRAAGLATR